MSRHGVSTELKSIWTWYVSTESEECLDRITHTIVCSFPSTPTRSVISDDSFVWGEMVGGPVFNESDTTGELADSPC